MTFNKPTKVIFQGPLCIIHEARNNYGLTAFPGGGGDMGTSAGRRKSRGGGRGVMEGDGRMEIFEIRVSESQEG